MKTSIGRSKPTYKLDPQSDRYRKCPNCGTEFMASHRSMEYCDTACNNEFHNLKKRREKQKGPQMAIGHPVSAPPSPLEPVTEKIEIPRTKGIQDNAANNIKILDSLAVDSKNGSAFHIEWLAMQGYDFGTFTGRGALHNIDPAKECHFIQMGFYRLFRIEYSNVLIFKPQITQ